MAQNNTFSLINYLAIALALLETPLSIVFHLPGGYIISAFLMIISLVLYKDDILFKKIIGSPPIVLWAIWIIYSLINWRIGPCYNMDMADPLYVLKRQVLPIETMILVYYEGVKNQKRTILFIVIVLAIFTIIGLTFQGRMTETSDRGDTMLGNHLPLAACVMTFFAFLAYCRSYIKIYFFYFVLVLALLGIFYIATRKALGGFVIIAFFYVIGKYDIKKPKYVFALAAISVLSILAYNYVMDYTLMGQRMAGIGEASAAYNVNDSFFLKFVGDRAVFYVLGWEAFLSHPLNGIGLTNFVEYAGMGFVLHTEYMVQLCENGIIGSFIYLMFNLSILSSIFKSRLYLDRVVFLTCLGGMICILFISFTAWTYSFPRYFAVYGIILAICRNPYQANLGNRKRGVRLLRR